MDAVPLLGKRGSPQAEAGSRGGGRGLSQLAERLPPHPHIPPVLAKGRMAPFGGRAGGDSSSTSPRGRRGRWEPTCMPPRHHPPERAGRPPRRFPSSPA